MRMKLVELGMWHCFLHIWVFPTTLAGQPPPPPCGEEKGGCLEGIKRVEGEEGGGGRGVTITQSQRECVFSCGCVTQYLHWTISDHIRIKE